LTKNSVLLAAAILLVVTTAVQAQTEPTPPKPIPSARDVLTFLVTTQGVQTGDVLKDREAAEATRDTIERALLVELASVPLTSSSGGFSYRFNPELGTVERVAQSFGPLFADRAVTGGRGLSSFSLTYHHADYVSLHGRDLESGALVTTANRFRGDAAPYDVEALSLEMQTTTVVAAATYGVLDRVDLGVAVPVIQVSLAGRRVNTYNGQPFLQATGTSNSTGIGDVAVRGKVQLLRRSGGAAGATFEVRLPTGSEENLRGAGTVGLKSRVVVSMGEGAVEGHANFGFAIGGVSDEVSLSGAVSAAVSRRVTLSGEALMRRLAGLHEIQEVIQPHPSVAGVETLRLLPTGPTSLAVTAVGGVRWNIASTLLLNAYVTAPLTDAGLKARVAPTISIEYSFLP